MYHIATYMYDLYSVPVFAINDHCIGLNNKCTKMCRCPCITYMDNRISLTQNIRQALQKNVLYFLRVSLCYLRSFNQHILLCWRQETGWSSVGRSVLWSCDPSGFTGWSLRRRPFFCRGSSPLTSWRLRGLTLQPVRGDSHALALIKVEERRRFQTGGKRRQEDSVTGSRTRSLFIDVAEWHDSQV